MGVVTFKLKPKEKNPKCACMEEMEGREGRENLRQALRLEGLQHIRRTKMGPMGLKEGARWSELRRDTEGNIIRQGLCRP